MSQVKVSQSAITCLAACNKHILVSHKDGQEVFRYKIPEDREFEASGFNLFKSEPDKLMVDGEVVSHRFDPETSNGFVVCRSGSIWYLDWDEQATL